MRNLKLKIYIDIYGRIGVCEKFPDTEEYAGMNDMLALLVDEEFYSDKYPDKPSGFYMCEFVIDHEDNYGYGGYDSYLQINRITEIEDEGGEERYPCYPAK